jgi:hypothetical protein
LSATATVLVLPRPQPPAGRATLACPLTSHPPPPAPAIAGGQACRCARCGPMQLRARSAHAPREPGPGAGVVRLVERRVWHPGLLLVRRWPAVRPTPAGRTHCLDLWAAIRRPPGAPTAARVKAAPTAPAAAASEQAAGAQGRAPRPALLCCCCAVPRDLRGARAARQARGHRPSGRRRRGRPVQLQLYKVQQIPLLPQRA